MTPHRAGALATAAAALLLIAALIALDLDISSARYLRSDLLFREQAEKEQIYPYRFIDPSPYAVWLPSDRFVRESLRAGRLPLWDPSQAGGFSPVTGYQNGVFFPLRWAAALVPEPQAHSALLIFSLAFAFLGAMSCALQLGISTPAAAVAGLLFALSPYSFSMLHFDVVGVMAFAPWILRAHLAWITAPSPRRWSLLAATIALAFTSGHPGCQFAMFLTVGLAVAADGLFSGRAAAALKGWTSAAIAGAACAGAVLAPFVWALTHAWTYKSGQGVVEQNRISYAALSFDAWWAHVSGIATSADFRFFDGPRFFEHLGVGYLLLVAFGAIAAVKERRLRFALPLAVFGFLLAVPGPWMAPGAALPLLKYTKPWYLFVAFALPLALLGSAGVDWLAERFLRGARWATAAAAVLLVVGPLVAFGWEAIRPIPYAPLPDSAGYRLLRADPEPFRVTGLWGQVHLANASPLTGIEDVRINAPLIPARLHAWWQLVDRGVMEQSFPTTRITQRLGSPLVGAFNVKYALRGKTRFEHFHSQITPGDGFGRVAPDAVPLEAPGWTKVFEDRYLEIYRNDASFATRAYFATRLAVVPPGVENAAAWVAANGASLRGTSIVEAPPEAAALLSRHARPADPTVVLSRPSPSSVRLETSPDTPALLVLAEAFDEGWSATLDGARAEVFAVDGISRGVFLEPGHHIVELDYVPPFLVPGALLSLAVALLLAVHARRR